jgi:5-bromo-4-chloroindolyl phosphate hydrolysis protein
MIQAQINVILKADQKQVKCMIIKHCFDVLQIFKSTYQIIKMTEKLYYELNSFFSSHSNLR